MVAAICHSGSIRAASLFPGAAFPMGPYPAASAVGDLNGDGSPDLVASDSLTGGISVIINRGDGTFDARPTIPERVFGSIVLGTWTATAISTSSINPARDS